MATLALDEARANWATKIPTGMVYQAQQAALMRVHLVLMGETHRMLGEAAREVSARVLRVGNREDPIDSVQAFNIVSSASEIVRGVVTGDWLRMFQAVRREAGSIPFGGLAVQIKHLPGTALISESIELHEGAEGVFTPQLAQLIEAANQHIYGDGLNLSARIWQLDTSSRERINQVVMRGLLNQKSAWNVAKELEALLGASQDCPRWTKTRLYGLTKQQIADGVLTGLESGAGCTGQGIAYNALRMARNEIQAIHHLANDQIMQQIPWVEKEQILLSAAHPALGCDCENIVMGGENGVYPKGQISLPIHVNCLCYKVAIQPSPEDFSQKLNGWVRGEFVWPAMDRFGEFMGGGREFWKTDFTRDPVSMALGVWLFGGETALLGRLGL